MFARVEEKRHLGGPGDTVVSIAFIAMDSNGSSTVLLVETLVQNVPISNKNLYLSFNFRFF